MVDFSKEVLTLNEQEIESELGEIVKNPNSPYWDEKPFSSDRDRYHTRATQLYEARSKQEETALQKIPREDRAFAHELNKEFGSKENVAKTGEEAREEWEDERFGKCSRKQLMN